MNEIVSITAGGVITIAVTIFVEYLRRPRLMLAIAGPVDTTYAPGRPARKGRYLYVELVNRPLPWFARWMSRNPALQCTGTITFHNLQDGERFFAKSMPVRFSRTPEPIPTYIQLGGATVTLLDAARAGQESRIDVYPGESTQLDIAAKFDDEDDVYGWSNLSYFSTPPWRNPEWRLPRGRYLVSVTVTSSGERCSALFRLLNEAGPLDFRLSPAREGDRIEL
jgi:hypothetical protein